MSTQGNCEDCGSWRQHLYCTHSVQNQEKIIPSRRSRQLCSLCKNKHLIPYSNKDMLVIREQLLNINDWIYYRDIYSHNVPSWEWVPKNGLFLGIQKQPSESKTFSLSILPSILSSISPSISTVSSLYDAKELTIEEGIPLYREIVMEEGIMV